MKIYWFKITVIGCLMLVLIGCTQVANPNAPNDLTPSTLEMTQPPQGDSTPMTPAIPTTPASGLENLIEMAKQDLAQRLAISANQIILIEATAVEWSDSSLDCPQPGMEYLQVITPGYRILLEGNETQYEYHSNQDAYVVICDNANPPILPKP